MNSSPNRPKRTENKKFHVTTLHIERCHVLFLAAGHSVQLQPRLSQSLAVVVGVRGQKSYWPLKQCVSVGRAGERGLGGLYMRAWVGGGSGEGEGWGREVWAGWGKVGAGGGGGLARICEDRTPSTESETESEVRDWITSHTLLNALTTLVWRLALRHAQPSLSLL